MVVLRTIAGFLIIVVIVCATIAGLVGFMFSLGYLWLRLTSYGYDDYTYCVLAGMPILLVSLLGVALIVTGYQIGNDFLKKKEK